MKQKIQKIWIITENGEFDSLDNLFWEREYAVKEKAILEFTDKLQQKKYPSSIFNIVKKYKVIPAEIRY